MSTQSTEPADDRSEYDARIKKVLAESQRLQSRQASEANFKAIVELSTAALCIPEPSLPALSDSTFFYYRGCALLDLYRLNRESRTLDSALEDLRKSPTNDGRARAFLNAHVEKSFLLKNTAAAEAVTLLEEAEHVINAHPNKNLRKDFEDKIRGNLADSRLRGAIQVKDVAAIKSQAHAILTLPHFAFRFALPLHYAAQVLLDSPRDEDTEALLRRILALLDQASRQKNLPLNALTQLCGHTASLALRLGDEYAELALEQNLRAAAAAPDRLESAFSCSIIGRQCLDVGKQLVRRGDQAPGLDYFRDAIGWLLKATNLHKRNHDTNPLFDLAVTHGCIGEAFLRLQGSFGGPFLARKALEHFEKARKLGGSFPVLSSLIGEAHFRIGRYFRDAEHLKSAIRFKRESNDLYLPNRESWSIVGAAAALLHEMEGGTTWLDEAVTACIAAHKLNLNWPWPLLQIAAIMSTHSIDGKLADQVRSHLQTNDLLGETLRPLADALKEAAVDLVIENTEFIRQIIGGRTKVFVLSDQHRILSKALILKPTLRAQAEVEMASTLAFSQYLREMGAAERRHRALSGSCLFSKGDIRWSTPAR